MILIRKFQPPDFPFIIDIEKKVFDEHNPFFYMQFYETCSEGFLVAEMNGIIVGYVVGYRISEKTGRIFSLAVHPGYQNRGIGRALLREMINIFKEHRVSEILLEVRSSNVRAKRFYEKQGFSLMRMVEKYYSNGENAYLMKLAIPSRE